MADDAPAVNLKILSPNFEGDIALPDLAASTTVQELRVRIQDAMDTRPATERMRLIYRGRVVVNETDTLSDVFGPDNIRNSKEQSLHLVLRELPNSPTPPAPRSSTAPPNPFRPVASPPPPSPPNPPQTNNPFRALPQPRPNSQPHPPHHHHPHHHQHPQQIQNPFARLPIPPGLQQHLAQTMNQNLHHPHPHPHAGPTPLPQDQPSRDGTPAPAEGRLPLPPGVAPALAGPGGMPLAPNTTRTIRHETLGPNGERWTMTFNDTNITIPAHPNQQPFLPRAFPHPAGFPPQAFAPPPRPAGSPVPGDVNGVLNLVRAGLEAVRQDMHNARTLFQPPGGQTVPAGQPADLAPPPWRIERIRHHVQSLTQNLERVQRGLTHLLSNPSMAHNRDVASLQESTNMLREQAEALNAMLDRIQNTAASIQASSTDNSSTGSQQSSSLGTFSQPAPAQTQPQQITPQPSLADVGSELFILSSPQGPVGILFDQRGTYSTAPMGPTMPFQAFTQQFSTNRQLLAGIGQQIAHNSARFQNQLATAPPPQNGQGAQPAAEQPHNRDQNQNRPAAPNPAAEDDRLIVIANHLWNIFKYACFIYIFAGGGGWYRPVIMGIGAAIAYLAQHGIFAEQFAAIRRHFEALLPLAERAIDRNQPQNQNPVPAAQPGQDLTPGEAAQRLVRQHQENRFRWVRDGMRSTERAFALFVASLWPGIGERMVQAQEERVRDAAAEVQRLEEAARQQELDAQQARENEEKATIESQGDVKTEDGLSDVASSSKEKVAVPVAETD